MYNNFDKESYTIICAMILPLIGFMVGYAIGIYRKKLRENSGEAKVRQSLVTYCKNINGHVLNNVTLRLKDGSTTQVDHILVSSRGIFVIETKHYKGWIFGNHKSKRWTQIIYNNRHTFYNPLFQNYKHVIAIQDILDFLKPQFIHNIVVFTGESIFKTAKIENVCYLEELIPTIEKHSNNALSLDVVQFCVGRLEYMRLELTQKTDVEHQAYLAQKFGR